MKGTVLLVCCLFLMLLNQVRAQFFEAGNISYAWVSGDTYNFTATAYVGDTTKLPAVVIYFGADSIICLPARTSKPNVFTFSTNHTFAGQGSYTISVVMRNRIAGIQNIPNSMSTSITLTAVLVINPNLGNGYVNSPIPLNPPIANGFTDKPFLYNAGASDTTGDSLSYKLMPCQTAAGYTYPATSKVFGVDSLTGIMNWNSPVMAGVYNFCIVTEDWRQGFQVGSTMQEMEVTVSVPYLPMLDSVNVWSYAGLALIGERIAKVNSSLCTYPRTSITGTSKEYALSDTVLNGKLYKKLYSSNSSFGLKDTCLFGYIREDTVKRMVYFRDVNSVENIIYNFAMKVGDTIGINIFQNGYFQTGNYILDSIKTVTLNSTERIEFILNCPSCSSSHTLYWIEGIGNLGDFIYNYCDLEGFGAGFYSCPGFQHQLPQLLTCFEHNKNVYYDSCALSLAMAVDGSNNISSCFTDSCDYFLCFPGGIKEFNSPASFTVFPNPAASTVTIKSSEAKSFQVQLYNAIGQVVYSSVNISGQEFNFDVGEFPKGIYIILLTDIQNNVAGRQKLVVQ